MTAGAGLLACLISFLLMLGHVEVGQGTRFGDPGDKLAGGRPACTRRLQHRRDWPKMLAAGCAHRTLPCGTKVKVVMGPKVTTCWVVDRGPYGIHGDRPRGIIDLMPGPADRLGVTGRHLVTIVPEGRRPRHDVPGTDLLAVQP